MRIRENRPIKARPLSMTTRALRWSALVHAKSGKVTESVVEPAFRGATLDERQTKCLIEGLTAAPYNLTEPDDQAAPRRVSIIFEF